MKEPYYFDIEIAKVIINEYDEIINWAEFMKRRTWIYMCDPEKEFLVYNVFDKILNEMERCKQEIIGSGEMYVVRCRLWAFDETLMDEYELFFSELNDAENCFVMLTDFLDRKKSLKREI